MDAFYRNKIDLMMPCILFFIVTYLFYNQITEENHVYREILYKIETISAPAVRYQEYSKNMIIAHSTNTNTTWNSALQHQTKPIP